MCKVGRWNSLWLCKEKTLFKDVCNINLEALKIPSMQKSLEGAQSDGPAVGHTRCLGVVESVNICELHELRPQLLSATRDESHRETSHNIVKLSRVQVLFRGALCASIFYSVSF